MIKMQRDFKSISPEEFSKWNEKMVRKYDPDAFHHHSNPIIRYIEGKRVKVIFKLMDIDKDDRVLEIGCGAGNVIRKASNGKLFGIDISPFILAKAKQKLNQKVSLFQGDAQKLPCKNGIFMYVICSEVLEHLLYPSDALREMARILKPQGMVIISVPNELLINGIKDILIKLRIFRWLFYRRGEYKEMPTRMDDEWHLHTFRLNEWLNLFEKFFKVQRLRRIPFSWLPLRYAVRLEKLE
jgi:ubiquinone/menaquinone biosynthesis C-methylase UbiE